MQMSWSLDCNTATALLSSKFKTLIANDDTLVSTAVSLKDAVLVLPIQLIANEAGGN